LDPQIRSWREEKLQDHYVYLFTAALYFFLRENHQVVSRPVLVSLGVDKKGYCKILSGDMALEESYQNYLNHFNRIKERGLKYVDLTISDEHKELLKAQQ